jgi:diguanylate cyclase (GGDEF)-like protein
MVVGGAITASLAIVLLEHNTGMSNTFWVLHLLPIVMVVWFRDVPTGMVVGFIALLLGNLELTEEGRMMLSRGGLDVVVRTVIFLVFAILTRAVSGRVEDPDAGETTLDLSTGLTSGGAFNELVSLELERAQRYDRCFTLAYVRIENIEASRQRAGRVATEESLRRLGHQIKGTLRSGDIVARRGEQEFTLLLPETGDEAAGIVLQRIEGRLKHGVADEAPYLSFSIGAVTWMRGGPNVDQLHQMAYQSLHRSRKEGRVLNHEIRWEKGAPGIGEPAQAAI